MSYGSKPVKVGTVRVPKGFAHTTHYECAAWYTRTVTTEETTVDLLARPSLDSQGRVQIDSMHQVWFKATGTVTGSDFSPLWCGNRIGSKVDADKGKDFEFSVSNYCYELLNRIREGTPEICGCAVTLDAGWRVVEHHGIYSSGPNEGQPFIRRTLVQGCPVCGSQIPDPRSTFCSVNCEKARYGE